MLVPIYNYDFATDRRTLRYGNITAHHSVSDITAMGGIDSKTALALVGVTLNDEKLMKNDLV